MSPFIVSGIGTNVGKTIVSAILVEMLQADYWKPLQTGPSDSDVVRSLISNPYTKIHPVGYQFDAPLSPHHAAKMEGIKIDPCSLQLPKTKKPLFIEGSGGILSPLNDDLTQWEHFSTWNPRWILVVTHYLGSINHTLLSLALLKESLLGIIFNGKPHEENETFILNHSRALCLGRIPFLNTLDRRTIKWHANHLRPLWKETAKHSGTPLQMHQQENLLSKLPMGKEQASILPKGFPI